MDSYPNSQTVYKTTRKSSNHAHVVDLLLVLHRFVQDALKELNQHEMNPGYVQSHQAAQADRVPRARFFERAARAQGPPTGCQVLGIPSKTRRLSVKHQDNKAETMLMSLIFRGFYNELYKTREKEMHERAMNPR